jgi:hypothetical protein
MQQLFDECFIRPLIGEADLRPNISPTLLDRHLPKTRYYYVGHPGIIDQRL